MRIGSVVLVDHNRLGLRMKRGNNYWFIDDCVHLTNSAQNIHEGDAVLRLSSDAVESLSLDQNTSVGEIKTWLRELQPRSKVVLLLSSIVFKPYNAGLLGGCFPFLESSDQIFDELLLHETSGAQDDDVCDSWLVCLRACSASSLNSN